MVHTKVDDTFILDATATTASNAKPRRLVKVLATALIGVAAVVGTVFAAGQSETSTTTLTTSIAVGATNGDVSVCYFAGSNNASTILRDFAKIKERFSAVRTFATGHSDLNLIDLAAQAGLKIHAGLSSYDQDQGRRDIQAIVDGLTKHPNTVLSVTANGFIHDGGEWDHEHEPAQRRILADQNSDSTAIGVAKAVIRRLQLAAAVANVTASLPAIAMVQTDQDWLSNSGQGVPGDVDVVAVVIQPYYDATDASTTPIQDLTARWNAIVQAFPNKKIVLAGTGWPTNGPIVNGHYPSFVTAQKFVADALAWFSTGGGGDSPSLFAFQFVDSNRANFGLVDQAKQWKFEFTKPMEKSVPTYLAFANVDAKVVLGVNDLNTVTLLNWNGWTRDSNRMWIQNEDQYYSAAASPNTLGCMGVELLVGSHKPISKSTVHVSKCYFDETQSWSYNVATKQLQHLAYGRNCLTVWPSNEYPTLSTCAVPGSPELLSQQFEQWSM
ncbi:Aste57867_12403 [Aphanomyces stellatus]|uniref:glucan endo-1,3-beta-D-glucosidase n=1 Tax=Aphanomyces stellatus TaxID=120398 RepID=A0A485KW95_9STRA|nr:hypothetical protein As57867_012357 [Aphanomyces stellatus]VFT89254.1 Aste57867_12403 [Aphanomyces stellatus]